MNKTKYLLETFVWDMGLSISENRRRLNKFVMERETNIDKLVKSIKKWTIYLEDYYVSWDFMIGFIMEKRSLAVVDGFVINNHDHTK